MIIAILLVSPGLTPTAYADSVVPDNNSNDASNIVDVSGCSSMEKMQLIYSSGIDFATHIDEEQIEAHILYADTMQIDKFDNGSAAVTITRVISSYNRNGKEILVKEAELILLMAVSSVNEVSATATKYGIQGFTTLNYSLEQGDIYSFSIKFNTLSVRYVNLPTASTVVSSMNGTVEFIRYTFGTDYYNNHYISNPVAGTTYSKALNSGWYDYASDSLRIGLVLNFTNGDYLEYVRIVF